ncbi:RNA polymerase sigma factor [Alicyclobacillus sp. SO9]|uniref:RNA polymerase sigma factor n=1 Tax=Alicyclobacillus sp. SO9 TaxID=2665646 RepID=UPI0018E70CAA|nr:RNA polymerase sigma factor [Alicyclobacillus sp. SO9]QQE79028.1 RNA polymerase sigma factor [Alicyclobacillus sp. SO9]
MLNDMNIDEWYYKYVDDVHNYLVYFVGSQDVEDLVQETFIKAMSGIKGFKGKSSQKTWLLSIARNVAIDDTRRKSKIITMDKLGFISSQETLEDEIEKLQTYESVLDCINKMKKDYREVVLHRVVIGLSITETAETLGWSQSKVKTTLHRALKKLRASLTNDKEGGLAYDYV